MNYQKLWENLKEQSGYRVTLCPVSRTCGLNTEVTLMKLMENLENLSVQEPLEKEIIDFQN